MYEKDKRVVFYLTESHYKIVTQYTQSTGIRLESKPIFILPVDTPIDEVKQKIVFCFNSSRKLTENEDEIYFLGSDFLKEIKEKSWKAIYLLKKCVIIYDGEKKEFMLSFPKYDAIKKEWSTPIENIMPIDSIYEIDINKDILETLAKIYG